jgi:hypothetical protein
MGWCGSGYGVAGATSHVRFARNGALSLDPLARLRICSCKTPVTSEVMNP